MAAMLLVFAAAYVIRIQTASGEVVIHCAEPGIEISITRDGQPVKGMTLEKSATTERIGVGDIKVTVKGARANEFKVTQDSTTLLRNGQIVVGIELIDKVKVAGGDTPAADIATWQGWPADAPAPAIAPFDEAQAKRHQQEWADHLGVPVEYTNSIGMKFRLIPPGEFMMGGTPEEIEEALKLAGEDEWWREVIPSEGPQHKVILTAPIYLGIHEVTQRQYEEVMGKNPSYFAKTGPDAEIVKAVAGLDTSMHPVEGVSWNDAAEFCTRLSKKEELKPFYVREVETVAMLDGFGYRLPTEAEWEFACRAGTITRYWTGSEVDSLIDWFVKNSAAQTHPVGRIKSNPLGLYDMHGNVWEWCQDWWDANYYGQFSDQPAIDPRDPSASSLRRVARGGGWRNTASYVRSSAHLAPSALFRADYVGFRVALTANAVRASKATQQSLPGHRAGNAPPVAVAPFDEPQAKKHQQVWADHLGVPVEYTNSIGMKFNLIPPGEFIRGSTPAEITHETTFITQIVENDDNWRRFLHELARSEGPQHRVVLTRPFYLGVSEVTQSQYQRIAGLNPSHFCATGEGKDKVAGLDTANHPAETISWNDCAKFCVQLSELEGLRPCYVISGAAVSSQAGTGYHLPTEAEWEFACRAGTATRYWPGDADESLAKTDWSAHGRTEPVASRLPNPFGLYDLHGNVGEWIEDWWSPDEYAKHQDQSATDPRGPAEPAMYRSNRGGCWINPSRFGRSSRRNAGLPDYKDPAHGCRIAISVEAVKAAIDATQRTSEGRGEQP